MTEAVRMTGISKRYGDVQALDAVDLVVEKGTLHAVVGENGAGKTTLMRALYGAMIPDSGSIEVDSKPMKFRRSSEAIDAGIGMVSQHYGIIPDLNCLQNLMLGAEGGPVMNLRDAAARADQLAAQMGFSFDWRKDAATLSPAGAQKLEILKLLWRNARIMILDEPTAMLSPQDGDALFGSLRQLVDEGATVILVTHRLPEVMDHCKRVTVLRAGKKVADRDVTDTHPAELARLIVGGDVIESQPRDYEIGTKRVLSVNGLAVKGYRGDLALSEVSFDVREGELVGIAGVDGSGQRELFRALVGVARPVQGTIALDEADATRASTADRLERGLRLIAEDRHAEAVIEDWSLEENAALGLQRKAPFAAKGSVVTAARREEALAMAGKFKTKYGKIADEMASLSGGNQQRFVAARALSQDPRLVLAFQPARGLDLNATQSVYKGIRDACRAGAGALVVSFDLDELLEHCDRILVMNRGRMYVPEPGQERDRNAIGCLMVGAQP